MSKQIKRAINIIEIEIERYTKLKENVLKSDGIRASFIYQDIEDLLCIKKVLQSELDTLENKPLTIDEIKTRLGTPVYFKSRKHRSGWYILHEVWKYCDDYGIVCNNGNNEMLFKDGTFHEYRCSQKLKNWTIDVNIQDTDFIKDLIEELAKLNVKEIEQAVNRVLERHKSIE